MSAKIMKEEKASTIINVKRDTRRKESTTWMKEFRKLPPSQRKCRYMLTGEVAHKLCANAFRCGQCSYDQMMQDRIAPAVIPQTLRKVAGYIQPEDFYFHRGHSWTHLKYGGRVRVGMDDFSQRLVGRLTGIRLPKVGEKLFQGSGGWTIARDGRETEVVSPMDCVITAINPELKKNPYLINQYPYEKGWICMIEPINLRENLKVLLYGDDVRIWLEDESDRLLKRIETKVGTTAHDGGRPAGDILASLDNEEWSLFVGEFLLPKHNKQHKFGIKRALYEVRLTP
jgi:glycine cleavage system H lipoate-binding protein